MSGNTNTTEAPGCPLHIGETDADNRLLIRQGLTQIIDPLYEELAGRVDRGMGVDVPALTGIEVSERPFSDVRAAGWAEHGYTYREEADKAILAGATGIFENCLETSVLSSVTTLADVSPLRMPIGYDPSYSDRQIRAVTGVVRAVQGLFPRIDEVAVRGDNPDLILRHTYQGVITRDPQRALRRLVCQGIIISGQTEAILTADSVNGFGSTDELAKAAREAGLPSTFTFMGSRMLLMSIRHGLRVQDSLARGQDGLEFSRRLRFFARNTLVDLRGEVKAAREANLEVTDADVDTGQVRQDMIHLKQSYGGRCPAAAIGVPLAVNAIAHVAAQLPR